MMINPSTLLVVQNLKESLEFYTELLGLQLIEEHSDCMKLSIGEYEVIMFQGNAPSAEYFHGNEASSTLLFSVENLDAKISQLKSNGVVFVHEAPIQNRWGRYSAFKDPSGIIHELFEHST